jgi:hypothetical protein
LIVFRELEESDVARLWREMEGRYRDGGSRNMGRGEGVAVKVDEGRVEGVEEEVDGGRVGNVVVEGRSDGTRGKQQSSVEELNETVEETMQELNEILRTSRMMENVQLL